MEKINTDCKQRIWEISIHRTFEDAQIMTLKDVNRLPVAFGTRLWNEKKITSPE